MSNLHHFQRTRERTLRCDAHYEEIIQYSFKIHLKTRREKIGETKKNYGTTLYSARSITGTMKISIFQDLFSNKVTWKFHLNTQSR